MKRTRLKVCCIASVEEALLAIEHGADALGLVGAMPSGPGPIDDELIAQIARATPPPVATFLLTSETSPDAVVAHVKRTGVNTVQLVDDEVGDEVWSLLRSETPATRIVQVVHVCGRESIDYALRAAESVDALLLDSGNPTATVRELGGTGRVHDWAISREIVERSAVPVFLAGGLSSANVADAIQNVGPFGIDLCSGVRTGGKLDATKLRSLVEAIHSV